MKIPITLRGEEMADSLYPRSRTARKTVGVQPETRYARSGDVSIAYQMLGDAPLDLVWIPSLTHHVELNWENPIVARFLRRLARGDD